MRRAEARTAPEPGARPAACVRPRAIASRRRGLCDHRGSPSPDRIRAQNPSLDLARGLAHLVRDAAGRVGAVHAAIPAGTLRQRQMTLDDLLHQMPKVELHCHLLGTVRRATFEDLVRRAGAPISMAEIESFYTRGDKPVGVLRVLRSLDALLIRSADDLERIAFEYLEDAAAHHVRYSEFFWNPTGTARDSGIPYGDALAGIVRAIGDAERRVRHRRPAGAGDRPRGRSRGGARDGRLGRRAARRRGRRHRHRLPRGRPAARAVRCRRTPRRAAPA